MTKRKTYDLWEVKRSVHKYLPYCGGSYAYEGNYGSHAMYFAFGGVDFYFSYETLIGFKFPGERPVWRQNDWSTTTGKHLGKAKDRAGMNRSYTEEEFWILYAEQAAVYFGVKGVPLFAMECEPGSWDKTGNIVGRRRDEPAVPPSVYSSKIETTPPPPITTKRDAARRRALDRKAERAEKKRKAELRRVRKAAAKKAAATRRERLEAEEQRRRWAQMLEDVMFDLQAAESMGMV